MDENRFKPKYDCAFNKGRFVHIGNSIWQRSTRYDPWPAPLLLRWMAIKSIEAEHN